MKKSILFSHFFVLLFFCQSIFAINIQLLKGTHTILPEEDRAFSPFWGLTFWEKDVAKQIYTFSAKQLNKKIEEALNIVKDNQGAKNAGKAVDTTEPEDVIKQVKGILASQKNTATENLVSHMFNEAGGTFNVTNAPNNPVLQLKPENIGKILRMIADYQKPSTENVMVAKGKAGQGLKEEQLKKQIRQYLGNLGLKNSSGYVYKSADFSQFINALVGAVQESAAGLYAEGTAQGIVLGYMLAKSNTRQDLADYFTGFMGKPVTLDDKERYTSEQLKKIKAAGPNFASDLEFGNYVCAEVYQKKYASLLPKVVENNRVTWEGLAFSDCVETTIRNLANIATFNSEKQELGDAPKGVSMSQELKNFYVPKLHQNSAEVGNQKVHQAWSDLVENKPGMVYSRLLVKDSTDQLIIDDLCEGVIPVDVEDVEDVEDVSLPVKIVTIANKDYEVRVKNVDGKRYWLVPKTTGLLCCEIRSIASNIIVSMNDLFNLGLNCSVRDILRHNFVSKNFQIMCEKLKWSVSDSEMKKINDINSGGDENILVTVQAASGQSFTINLRYKKHGSVLVQDSTNSVDDSKMSLIVFADGMMQAACMSLDIIPEDLHDRLRDGVWLDEVVLNPDIRLIIIKQLTHKEQLTENEEQYLCKLIMSMGDLLNPHYQNNVFECLINLRLISINIAQALIVMATVSHVQNNYPEFYVKCAQLLVNPNNIKNSLDFFIEKGMASSDYNIQRNSLNVLSGCIEKGLIDSANAQQVLLMVEKGMVSSDSYIQRNSLDVLSDCIKKGLIDSANVQQVLSMVEKGMASSDSYMQCHSLDVLSVCIKKGLIDSANVQQVLSMAAKGIVSDDFFVQDKALRVLSVCIEKGLIDSVNVQQVLSMVKKGIVSSDYHIQRNSWDVLSVCIEKGLIDSVSVQQVLSMAETGRASSNFEILNLALKVLILSVEKGLIDSANVQQVLSMVEKEMTSSNYYIQRNSWDVLSVCIKKGLIQNDNVQEVLSIAEKGIASDDSFVQESVLGILTVSLEKGLINSANSSQVLSMVEKTLTNLSFVTQKLALEVLNISIEKGLVQADNVDKLLTVIRAIQVRNNADLKKLVDDVSNKLLEIQRGQSKLNIAKNTESKPQETQKTETTFDAAEHKKGLNEWQRELNSQVAEKTEADLYAKQQLAKEQLAAEQRETSNEH
jgi:hypothetical protein